MKKYTPYDGRPQSEVVKTELAIVTQKTEDNRPLLTELISCTYAIAQTAHGPSEKQLQLLYQGIQASWSNISFWHSGYHLAQLSHYYPKAGDVLIQASQHPRSSVRFNAVMALLAQPAQNVIDDIVGRCIADKSSTVRAKVADVCMRIEDKTKVVLLQKQLQAETNEKVKADLLFAAFWLENDYELLPGYHKGTYDLRVKINTAYMGITISQEQMNAYGIEQIVQWVKDDKWADGPIEE